MRLRPTFLRTFGEKRSSRSDSVRQEEVFLLRRPKTLSGRKERDGPGTAHGSGHPSQRIAGSGEGFPTRAVLILALCMGVHSFTFVSLFPYVGMMVKECLKLDSIDEAGNTESDACVSTI